VSRLRVAVIGARRARQGLGPFIARDLLAAGADVVGLLATSSGSGAEASAQCERFAGVRPRAYTDLAALLDETRPQALAICSPHATHAALLDVALARGLHVLCEKPLVWGDDFASRSLRAVEQFQQRELVLFENCQWPYILPAFAELHPGALGAAPQRFAMALEPAARGRDMLADSLPHPLSLLQALAPAAAPRAERVDIVSKAEHGVELRFAYVVPSARISVRIDLEPSEHRPRRFALAIDDCTAERQVDPADYALRLVCGERSVPLPDPMAALIADFVACAAAGRDPRAAERLAAISARAQLLDDVAAEWPDAPAAARD
jgi:hypothetical protein